MTPVTTTIYLFCFLQLFPHLGILCPGNKTNDIVSRRNGQIRKAASRGMPLCGAWPKLTMKWPLIKGQARPDPETHKWRKLLWPLLPPPLYQINQFGLSAVHPFDACYQKLKYSAYVLHYIYSKAQQFGEAEIIISGHPYKHRKAKWTALPKRAEIGWSPYVPIVVCQNRGGRKKLRGSLRMNTQI